eukprot:TRINITY_DN643_c0_g1_i1.p1 TRINITY_DN643_c0_g1~~TRINITY_DN643_c0_g1_i1.p1  ORF type:complete len:281 (+),score=29.71 TRINITY_DN643_c0_g1_i1:262-1104(+)
MGHTELDGGLGEDTGAADTFRDYSAAPAHVKRNYELNHTNQHYDWVVEQIAKYGACNSGLELSIWDAAEKLNGVIDDSDPDITLPQIEHLLQTAEAIRKVYPGEEYDWFHLTGFVHDLGKLLAHKEIFNQPQWAVVGDTYPLGCEFDKRIVFHDYFSQNPDSQKAEHSTPLGIYEPKCGLDKLTMSWGHDEYMYQVCLKNGCTLPAEGLYIIRFHSFYAYHLNGAYRQFQSETDVKMFPWLKAFQRCDLYSKEETRVNVAELKEYYQGLIAKYFPPTLKW